MNDQTGEKWSSEKTLEHKRLKKCKTAEAESKEREAAQEKIKRKRYAKHRRKDRSITTGRVDEIERLEKEKRGTEQKQQQKATSGGKSEKETRKYLYRLKAK